MSFEYRNDFELLRKLFKVSLALHGRNADGDSYKKSQPTFRNPKIFKNAESFMLSSQEERFNSFNESKATDGPRRSSSYKLYGFNFQTK